MQEQATTQEVSPEGEAREIDAEIIRAVQSYSVQDAAIAELRAEYSLLKIAGPDDRKGYLAVSEARKHMKRLRVSVDKTRKALNADALKCQRAVNDEAKRIASLIEPVESDLQAKEDEYQAAKMRQREEEERAKAARLKKRMDQLDAVRAHVPSFEVEKLDDDAFAALLDEKTAIFEAERAQEEEERRAALAEEKRREAERQEREAQEAAERARVAEEQRQERERLAAERAELERRFAEIEAERERRATAEREKAEAERQEREVEEAKRRKEAEERRLAELAPQREKVAAYLEAVLRVEVPVCDYRPDVILARARFVEEVERLAEADPEAQEVGRG